MNLFPVVQRGGMWGIHGVEKEPDFKLKSSWFSNKLDADILANIQSDITVEISADKPTVIQSDIFPS